MINEDTSMMMTTESIEEVFDEVLMPMVDEKAIKTEELTAYREKRKTSYGRENYFELIGPYSDDGILGFDALIRFIVALQLEDHSEEMVKKY